MDFKEINDDLIQDLQKLQFTPPVNYVYNPLVYARRAYDQYVDRYAGAPREAVFLGMNPGPWGMAQTGVPFGEVQIVKNWLKINAPVGKPPEMHPKRPVEGFRCTRSEISGQRLWGWAREHFKTPERFFARFFVANYCPLIFIEKSGRNRTPNNIRAAEKKPLLAACDRALQRTIAKIKPRYVVGIGVFATERARAALSGFDVVIGRMTHPSPANPQANRGWAARVAEELSDLGIQV